MANRWYGLAIFLGVLGLLHLFSESQRLSGSKSEPNPGSSNPSKARMYYRTIVGQRSRRNSSQRRIKRISLLGERNSGTNWMFDHLSMCFNGSIDVYRNLTRDKHWFQHRNYSKYPHDTLVLLLFRNPYDWLRAMQSVPHHASLHIGLKWQDFLFKEWTMPRFGLDMENSTDTICQEDFPIHQLISCNEVPLPLSAYNGKRLHFSEQEPFYELKEDGTPYENIMSLREAKIRNLLDIRTFEGVADLWIYQYETLKRLGTEKMLHRIEEATGLSRTCDSYEPQSSRRVRNISKSMARAINDNVNWSTEALIGYFKHKIPKDHRPFVAG